MSFDWKLYIQLSDELINYQRTAILQEAYLRTAISRSYYGVFCIARNLLSKKTTIPKIDTHKFVREKYEDSINITERKIGASLNRLWRKRKNADYNNKANININEAIKANQMAYQTINNLTKIGAI